MSGGQRHSNEEQALKEARRFLDEETQFHLGILPTESSHPKTKNFSATIQRDTTAGASMLLSVDRDIPPRAAEVFQSAGYAALVREILRASHGAKRVGFSGCGATGRLAIILERMWREYWEAEAVHIARTNPPHATVCRQRAENGYSIMTGGDRALIRSVENFEDFQEFGRRQVRDLGLAEGDVLVAISEGGETSSVIGTVWEAYERGCSVFFVFNNPTEVLARHIERSRKVIECPGIIKIDLFTGPMALSGSTRLQATTAEMLVVGAALEQAVTRLSEEERPSTAAVAAGASSAAALAGTSTDGTPTGGAPHAAAPAIDYAAAFQHLVDELSAGAALSGLAAAIDLETNVYKSGGLITYVTDEYLLDIISDTTERTPTFMIPPFRPTDDTTSSPSWAFVKDPVRRTREAWDHMLRRAPRGISWTRDDYVAMKGSEWMTARPPSLDVQEIYRYAIGNEPDPGRHAAPVSALLAVAVGEGSAESLLEYLIREGGSYTQRSLLSIGAAASGGANPAFVPIQIPLECQRTPMNLFFHLAVKLIFNTLSTGTMGKLGRILDNWMIQVNATNKKLVDRATRIISELGKISYEDACIELHKTLAEQHVDENLLGDSCVVRTLARLGRLTASH